MFGALFGLIGAICAITNFAGTVFWCCRLTLAQAIASNEVEF